MKVSRHERPRNRLTWPRRTFLAHLKKPLNLKMVPLQHPSSHTGHSSKIWQFPVEGAYPCLLRVSNNREHSDWARGYCGNHPHHRPFGGLTHARHGYPKIPKFPRPPSQNSGWPAARTGAPPSREETALTGTSWVSHTQDSAALSQLSASTAACADSLAFVNATAHGHAAPPARG